MQRSTRTYWPRDGILWLFAVFLGTTKEGMTFSNAQRRKQKVVMFSQGWGTRSSQGNSLTAMVSFFLFFLLWSLSCSPPSIPSCFSPSLSFCLPLSSLLSTFHSLSISLSSVCLSIHPPIHPSIYHHLPCTPPLPSSFLSLRLCFAGHSRVGSIGDNVFLVRP